MLPLRPVMSSGWLTDVFPLGVLTMIGVVAASALLVNPEAPPVGEPVVLPVLDGLAALLVLDELAALLDEPPEPQLVNTTAAITAPAARLTVDTRQRRGALKWDGPMIGSARADISRDRVRPARSTVDELTRVTAPTCHQCVNAS